jgi:hypothetical protein
MLLEKRIEKKTDVRKRAQTKASPLGTSLAGKTTPEPRIPRNQGCFPFFIISLLYA